MSEYEKINAENQTIKDLLKKIPTEYAVFAWEQFLKDLANEWGENKAKDKLLKDLKRYANSDYTKTKRNLVILSKNLEADRVDLQKYLLGDLDPRKANNELGKNIRADYFIEDDNENNQEKITETTIEKEIENLNRLYEKVGLKLGSLNRCFEDYLNEEEKIQNDKKLSTINKQYDSLVAFTESLHLIMAFPTNNGLRNVIKTIAKLKKIDEKVEELAKELKINLHVTFKL